MSLSGSFLFFQEDCIISFSEVCWRPVLGRYFLSNWWHRSLHNLRASGFFVFCCMSCQSYFFIIWRQYFFFSGWFLIVCLLLVFNSFTMIRLDLFVFILLEIRSWICSLIFFVSFRNLIIFSSTVASFAFSIFLLWQSSYIYVRPLYISIYLLCCSFLFFVFCSFYAFLVHTLICSFSSDLSYISLIHIYVSLPRTT